LFFIDNNSDTKDKPDGEDVVKTDTVYKQALNQTLAMLAQVAHQDPLPSENELRRKLGVSRTTIRKVLQELAHRSIITGVGSVRIIGRAVDDSDYFPDVETTSKMQQVERQFMEWMLLGDTAPGALINELELARQFGVATNGIREFLIHFSRFGLIEKRPNSGWLFKGFTREFALELFEIRVMFELRSARLFAQLPESSPLFKRLRALRKLHCDLLESIGTRYHDFSGLDNQFHRLVNEVSPNRFIDDFYDVISFIFHYHYQWNKKDELQRNRAAVLEHLVYIDALLSRDSDRIEEACQDHLKSAKETLIQSVMGAE
jgi:DNA-binding GntR family transcriptional regulator